MEHNEFPQISTETFAYWELKEDPSYPNIPKEERLRLILAGIAAGERMANQYRGEDLERLMTEDGVVMHRFTEPSPVGMHAQIQYDAGVKRVDLFLATAKQLEQVMHSTPHPYSAKDFERMFLAHEFYHWLEYSGRTPFRAGIKPLRHKLFGLIPHSFTPCRLSEIAAHAFTNRFCCLPFDSRLPDYLIMYQKTGKSTSEVYDELRNMQAQYQAECL